ncbi:MAG: ATP-dependent Clp protease ATP-binding subunit ClpA, partial [uncultured Sphingomonadaceae bacterium]
GAADAGEDQAAARRGAAVRQARARRRGQGPHQGQRPRVRSDRGRAEAAQEEQEGCQRNARERGGL